MPYRLFKPRFRDRKSGRRMEASRYYIEFRDHHNIRHRWPALAHRDDSDTIARHLVELVRCRRTGDPVEGRAARWLPTAPSALRAKLIAAGIIDPPDAAQDEPLTAHLEGRTDADGAVTFAGYRQHLLNEGDTAEHVELTVGRVRRVFDACAFTFWKDLCEEGAALLILTRLGEMRQRDKRPIRGKTINYYVRAVKAFCNWFVHAAERAPENPLTNLKRVRVTEAESKQTRELAPEELAWLLAATKAAPARFGMEPAERVLLYRFAYETGIRPGQIRAMTVSAFDLDADPPHVTSAARTVKTRREHTQPLRAETAGLLRKEFENRLPEALAFPTMPDKFTCAEMFRADLADARRQWIEAAGNDARERVKRGRATSSPPSTTAAAARSSIPSATPTAPRWAPPACRRRTSRRALTTRAAARPTATSRAA